jgi:hypothetical protein
MTVYQDVKDQLSLISTSAHAINDDVEKAETVRKARTRMRGELLTIARACKEGRKLLADLNRQDKEAKLAAKDKE